MRVLGFPQYRALCRVAEKLGFVPVRIDAGSAETEGEYVDALSE